MAHSLLLHTLSFALLCPCRKAEAKQMSVWGRKRGCSLWVTFSDFPSPKPDGDLILYNYCNFVLPSCNAKCLCRYFYTFTVLSGSWGLYKDGTCQFCMILWNLLWYGCDPWYAVKAVSCLSLIQDWELGEEEVKWLLGMTFKTWVQGCENSTSKDCLQSLKQLYTFTGIAASLNFTHYLVFQHLLWNISLLVNV